MSSPTTAFGTTTFSRLLRGLVVRTAVGWRADTNEVVRNVLCDWHPMPIEGDTNAVAFMAKRTEESKRVRGLPGSIRGLK